MQTAVEEWGLREERPVIVHDLGRGLYASRAWWILRWAGIENVSILEGGTQAWKEAGLPLIKGPGSIAVSSNATVKIGAMPTVTIDEVREHQGILLDVRDARRFTGDREVLDLEAGHIPGAINVPVTTLLTSEYHFLPAEEIRTQLAQVGINEDSDVIVYSGSGNHSAQAIAALEIAGIRGARHYLGGWSQWSADSQNAVERGKAVR